MISKIRVLIVDDEAAILCFLKPALEANSYDIFVTATVAQTNSCGSVGGGSCRGYAISSRLYRPAPAKDRGEPR